MIDYKQYIAINSEIRFGKPIILNTRITVFDVLNLVSKWDDYQRYFGRFS